MFTSAQIRLLEKALDGGRAYTTTWGRGDIHPNTGYSLARLGYVEHWGNEFAGGNNHYVVFRLTHDGKQAYYQWKEERHPIRGLQRRRRYQCAVCLNTIFEYPALVMDKFALVCEECQS